jgi:hypothetical protein
MCNIFQPKMALTNTLKKELFSIVLNKNKVYEH